MGKGTHTPASHCPPGQWEPAGTSSKTHAPVVGSQLPVTHGPSLVQGLSSVAWHWPAWHALATEQGSSSSQGTPDRAVQVPALVAPAAIEQA
jgi:hypothetical protein